MRHEQGTGDDEPLGGDERSGGTEDAPGDRARGTPGASAASPRRAWWRVAITAAVLAAVWWPARPGGRDGFPLSTYPMFGYARAPTSVVDTALGVEADGRRRPLTPELLVGTAQAKLALSTVRRAIARGHARALCEEVAARTSARADGERREASPSAAPSPLARVVAIEVVTDTWDTLDALRPGAAPRRRVVHARCEVPHAR